MNEARRPAATDRLILRRTPRRPGSERLVPLINLAFLLLILILLLGTRPTPPAGLQLPRVMIEEASGPAPVTGLAIDADGQWRLQGQALSENALRAHIEAEPTGTRPLAIWADARVTVAAMSAALAQLASHGRHQVRLLTDMRAQAR